MADYSAQLRDELGDLGGFIAAALADSDSGMALGTAGGANDFNIDVAAAANTEVVRAKHKAMKSLKLDDALEDILISLGTQYHLIRPLKARPQLFLYLSLRRDGANLALARMKLKDVEANIDI